MEKKQIKKAIEEALMMQKAELKLVKDQISVLQIEVARIEANIKLMTDELRGGVK